MLEVCEVVKRLGGTMAVDGVSFSADAGECICLVGTNGAGKSTLLSLVAGVLRPDRGEVLWKGEPAYGKTSALQHGCGYVPEAANPPMQLTVADLLHLMQAVKQTSAISSDVRARLGLDGLMGARLDQLSLGQRRRACLGAALVGSPALLVLDEPTNGLDPEGISTLRDLVIEQKERGAILVLATHDLEFAQDVQTRRIALALGKVLP